MRTGLNVAFLSILMWTAIALLPIQLAAAQPARPPIEAVMRDLQIRHQWLRAYAEPGWSLAISWPVCACGGGSSPTPAYPKDGFYDACADNPETMRDLVKAIDAQVRLLAGSFVAEEWWDLSGKPQSSVIEQLSAPTQWSNGDISIDNYAAICGALQEFVRKMAVVRVSSLYADPSSFRDRSGEGVFVAPEVNPMICQSSGGGTGAYETLKGRAISSLSEPVNSFGIATCSGGTCWDPDGGLTGFGGFGECHETGQDGSTGEIYPGSIRIRATDFRMTIPYPISPPDGVAASVSLYYSIVLESSIDSGESPELTPGPPVKGYRGSDNDDWLFELFDSGELPNGGWTSKRLIEDIGGLQVTIDCSDYQTSWSQNPLNPSCVYALWYVSASNALITATFTPPAGEGECVLEEESILPGAVQENDDAEEADDEKDAEDDCGDGQSGGAGGKHAGGTPGMPSGMIDPAFGGSGPGSGGGPENGSSGMYPPPRYELFGNPMGPTPVNYAWGHKHETVTDLTVSATGQEYSVVRQYASRTRSEGLQGYGLVGANWTLSNFRFIKPGIGNTLVHSGGSVSNTVFQPGSGGPTVWRPAGPQTHFISESTQAVVTGWDQEGVSALTVPIWRMVQPGGWETDYYRASGSSDGVDDALDGLVREWRDTHGNTRSYEYDLFDGSVNGVSTTVARLRAVYLNRAFSTIDPPVWDAKIFYSWILNSDAEDQGRLRSISVFRRTDSGSVVVTDEVSYLYLNLTEIGSVNPSPHLGSPGDLIEVRHRKLADSVDPDLTGGPHSRYRTRVTQYRYHTGGGPGDTGSERLRTQGGDHQLRLVIYPEQVEYYAQKANAEGSTWEVEESIVGAADELRELADSESVSFWPSGSTAPLVVDLAGKIISYEPAGARRVTTQYLQTGCGCSGAATQAKKEVYSYLATLDDVYRTARVAEHLYVGGTPEFSTSPYRTSEINLKELRSGGGYHIVSTALIEAGGRTWVNAYVYNDQGSTPSLTLTKHATPSAVSSYTSAVGTTAASATISTSQGLVYAFAYNSERRRTEIRVGNGNVGSVSQFDLLQRITYYAGSSGNERPWLVRRIDQFPTVTTSVPSESSMETVWLTYGFHAGDAIAWARTFVEAELEGENGPVSTGVTDPEGFSISCYQTVMLFDERGRARWSMDADGTLTFRDYSQHSNRMTKLVQNADPTGEGSDNPVLVGSAYGGISTSGWGRWVGGVDEELTTSFGYDLLGRLVVSQSPGGVKSFTRRELRQHAERPGVLYYSVLSLPHKLSGETAPAVFSGPISVSFSNAGGRSFASHEYTIPSSASAYEPLAGVYELSAENEVAKSTVKHLLSGLVDSIDRVQNFVSGTGDVVNTTFFEYDELGRQVAVVDPIGGRTEYSFDVQDRVIETRVGTTSSTPVVVSSFYYDDDNLSNGPHQGLGNGNLNYVRLNTADSTLSDSATRDVTTVFDWRDRPVVTENPLPPHELVVYDNLDRVVERGLFSAVPTSMSATNRSVYSRTFYSQRGLPFNRSVAVDPSQSSPTFLESHSWFDAEGRTIASWSPNSPGTKVVYDAHGRASTTYITDRGGDAAPGTGSYADASSVVGDVVLEQSLTKYDMDPSRWAGAVLMSISIQRSHDSTVTGPLLSSDHPITYVGYFYDKADRLIRTVNFGTNTSDDVLTKGGTEPTWPDSEPPTPNENSNRLVSAISFDARGLTSTTTDPAGKVHGYMYDAMGREIAVVENNTGSLSPLAPGDIVWDAMLGRWKVTGGLDIANPDRNRITSFVYDAAGNLVKQVAHLPHATQSEQVQETQYVYGTTDGSAGTATNSLLASKSLLREVRYPNETTGAAGGDGDDHLKVRYAYNRLGELRSIVDQSGTRHIYNRDNLGRVKADTADALGTDIDDSIRRIGVAFDTSGRIDTVTSYSNTSGTTAVNQVKFEYTPLWQVSKLFQDHNGLVTQSAGAPTGDTQLVSYSYSTAVPASGTTGSNYSRLASLTYPDGTVQSYAFGSAASTNDRISRIGSLDVSGLGSLDLVKYHHLGLGTTAIVDYDASDVQLDRTINPPGAAKGTRRFGTSSTGPAGVYPGYDRFGRVAHQAWVDGDFTTHASEAWVPNVPPLSHSSYQYDKASNRTGRHNRMPGYWQFPYDEEYVYDGLDRLTEAKRGVRSTNGTTWSSLPGSRVWVLDALGNWVTTREDLSGNGTYADSADKTDERTHNQANEIVERSFGPSSGGSPVVLPFSYDPAGNLRSAKRDATASDRYTHDAWNRLVKHETVASGGGNVAILVNAHYGYNGLHWRIYEDNGNVIPQLSKRLCYSASWQLLEEHYHQTSGGFTFEGEGGTMSPARNWVGQIFWGVRHIDDAVLRRLRFPTGTSGEGSPPNQWVWTETDDFDWYHLTDVQFSVRGMVPIGLKQPVAERVHYDAYGKATHHLGTDVNFDGTSDVYDLYDIEVYTTTIDDSSYNYRAATDLNRDGVTDETDLDIASAWEPQGRGSAANHGISESTRPWEVVGAGSGGAIPGPDNPVGYCGYVMASSSRLYAVRFRWYDPAIGRWLQRDPAGYVDGANKYQYNMGSPLSFIDPFGLCADCHGNPFTGRDLGEGSARGAWALLHTKSPCPTLSAMHPISPTEKVMKVDKYWAEWKKANPGYTDDQYTRMRRTLDRGCIGVTAINLGTDGNPDLSSCFGTLAQATAKKEQMADNCECKGKGPPLVFGKRFWSNQADQTKDREKPDDKAFLPDSTSGKVDMSNYRYYSRPKYVNFDYAWPLADGRLIHANHHEPGMEVYTDDWPKVRDFDREIYCVTCGSRNFGDPSRP